MNSIAEILKSKGLISNVSSGHVVAELNRSFEVDEDYDLPPLIHALLCSKVICTLLNLDEQKAYGMPQLAVGLGGQASFVREVVSLACQYGHDAYNEVHLLLAAIVAFRSELQSVPSELTSANRSTTYRRRLLDLARDMGDVKKIEEASELLSVHVTDWEVQMQDYLASPFYPYRQEELQRFLSDPNAKAIPVGQLSGFVVHATID